MKTLSYIEISKIKKRYPSSLKDSLDNINLSIKAGEIRGFLGPNGAGKTTLISILCKLIEPTSGSVTYSPKPNSLKELKRKIGFVPQEFAFYHNLTPNQNLKYFGSLYGIPKNELKKNISNILDFLNLSEFKNKKINTLSGGMKRRINLALGLVHNPSILFLDEPTAGVDIHNKRIIMDILKEQNKKGTTIIYSSHDLHEAEQFCSHITLLNSGQIIEDGELKKILTRNDSNSLEEIYFKKAIIV